MDSLERRHCHCRGTCCHRPVLAGSQSRRDGFCVRQLPIDPATGTFPGGVTEQTKRSLLNCKAILEQAGLGFENVVKTTVFLKDMNDFAAMNEVYASFFAQPYPARAAFEVARLPKDAQVEIEMIAVE